MTDNPGNPKLVIAIPGHTGKPTLNPVAVAVQPPPPPPPPPPPAPPPTHRNSGDEDFDDKDKGKARASTAPPATPPRATRPLDGEASLSVTAESTLLTAKTPKSIKDLHAQAFGSVNTLDAKFAGVEPLIQKLREDVAMLATGRGPTENDALEHGVAELRADTNELILASNTHGANASQATTAIRGIDIRVANVEQTIALIYATVQRLEAAQATQQAVQDGKRAHPEGDGPAGSKRVRAEGVWSGHEAGATLLPSIVQPTSVDYSHHLQQAPSGLNASLPAIGQPAHAGYTAPHPAAFATTTPANFVGNAHAGFVDMTNTSGLNAVPAAYAPAANGSYTQAGNVGYAHAVQPTATPLVPALQHAAVPTPVAMGASAASSTLPIMGNGSQASHAVAALPVMFGGGTFDVEVGPGQWPVPPNGPLQEWKRKVSNIVLPLVGGRDQMAGHSFEVRRGKDNSFVVFRFSTAASATRLAQLWVNSPDRCARFPNVYAVRLN